MPLRLWRSFIPLLPAHRPKLLRTGLQLVTGCLLTLGLQGQTTLYWDLDGPTAGAGGTSPSGGWRTNSNSYKNWNTQSDGSGAAEVWTADSIAVFSAGTDATGSYTVTVNSVSADSIIIQEGNITFNSSTITFTGATPGVEVATGLTATFASKIAGTDFVKSGAGTLIFQGTGKIYTGETQVNAGTLQLGASNMIGNAADVNVATGATFDLNGFSDTVGSIAGAGSITLGAGTLTIDGDAETTEFSGTIAGSGNLAKTGTDTLILSGANSYDGTTTVSGGVLNIRHATALGSTTGGTSVTSGRALEIQGGITVGAEALSLTGTGISSSGALRNISDNNTLGGVVTLTGNTTVAVDGGSLDLSGGVTGSNRNLTVAAEGDLNLSGGLTTGTGTLVKTGAGTLTLGGSSTYSGVTSIGSSGGATGGTLRTSANDVLADANLTVYAGSLDLNGHNDTIGALSLGGGASGTSASVSTAAGTLTLGGNITYSASNNADGAVISGRLDLGGSDRTFTVNNSSAADPDLTVNAVISGANGVIKSGSGTLVLAGANTYTGATTVSGGVLNIQHGSALGSTAAGTTVNSGYTLELQGGITVTGESLSITGSGYGGVGALRNVSGDNTWSETVTLANTTQIRSEAGTLTLTGGIDGGGGNRNLTINGDGHLNIGPITTGSGTLTKNDSGTTTLNGSNTFTGNTYVNAGTLRLGSGGTLNDATDLILSAGATFDLNGQTDTVATLAGTGGTVAINGGALTTSGSGSTTFSGELTGSGAFTKQGTGVLTFDSTTDFTFNGTFNLAGGTLRLSDLALTVNTLNITGNSIIDFTGVSSLSVINLSISGGVALTIQNWANASDFFFAQNWTGASYNLTSTTPMDQITFNGAASTDTKWLSYEDNAGSGYHQITPVPEPSTYGALLLAATGGLLAWRRRVSRRGA